MVALSLMASGLLMAMKAPSITTTTMIVPSMIVVTFGSTASSVRSVRTRRRTKTATIGPTSPPRPPPSVTPPSTTAATLASRYGPGMGAPMPVLMVSARPPIAANSPASA